LHSPPTIAHGDGDRALGGGLPNNVAVELRYELAWCEVLHRRIAAKIGGGERRVKRTLARTARALGPPDFRIGSARAAAGGDFGGPAMP
jgi:hypothetical protein